MAYLDDSFTLPDNWRMSIITLTTDFGYRSGFTGVLKGVIYSLAPNVKIVDISHGITAQDVHEGSSTLWRACRFFPKGAIHVFIVDPGVGTRRRPLAGRLGDHFFVGPDNGLLTPMMEDAERASQAVEFVHLDNPLFWLPKVSRTFHGRDIFAPVAAHLSNGVPLAELGTAIHDPVRMEMFRPQKIPAGWIAHVTVIDNFGNLGTDLPAGAIQDKTCVRFRIRETEIRGVADSYGYRPAGDLVAVVDSEDFIELAEVNGSAARRLKAEIGDEVEVILSE